MADVRKTGSGPAPGADQGLRAFVNSYGRAFIAGDVEALSSRFSYPCHVAGDTGDHSAPSLDVVADRVGLANLLRPVMHAYHQLGVARAEIAGFTVTEISPRLRAVRVHWQLRAEAGRAIYSFCAAYTIAGAVNELAIVAIAHDEIIHAHERLRKSI